MQTQYNRPRARSARMSENESTIVTAEIQPIRPNGKGTAVAEGQALGELIPEPVVSVGYIAPIEAKDVRLPPLEVSDTARAVSQAIGKVLGAPEFSTPPDADNPSAMRVTFATAARAVSIADAYLASEMSADVPEGARNAHAALVKLAHAYRKASERRPGRLLVGLTADEVNEAQAVAISIVAAMEHMPINGRAADLLTLAFSFLSRLNAERAAK